MPYNFFKGVVIMGGGIYRGEFQLLAFKLMNPYERFFLDYYNLYCNVEDADFLERHHRFRNWYECVRVLPEKWYLRVVDQLFVKNNLVKGKMKLFNKKVDLKNIDCPVLMIAGSKDDITTSGRCSTPKNTFPHRPIEWAGSGRFRSYRTFHGKQLPEDGLAQSNRKNENLSLRRGGNLLEAI